MPFERERVLAVLGQAFTDGLTVAELGIALGVRKREQHRLRKLLGSLKREGRVVEIGRGAYALAAPAAKDARVVGRISIHPAGITHGPHPGTYEKSIGQQKTAELAVMCDTLKPLWLTTEATAIEQQDYHTTWVDTTDAVHK